MNTYEITVKQEDSSLDKTVFHVSARTFATAYELAKRELSKYGGRIGAIVEVAFDVISK